MSDPGFSSANNAIDQIVAGGNPRTALVNLTDLAATGALVRGTVLGKKTADDDYGISLDAAVDGTEVPRAILAVDADPSGGDVEAGVYMDGDFNEDELTYGTGMTRAKAKEPLRGVGINLKKPTL